MRKNESWVSSKSGRSRKKAVGHEVRRCAYCGRHEESPVLETLVRLTRWGDPGLKPVIPTVSGAGYDAHFTRLDRARRQCLPAILAAADPNNFDAEQHAEPTKVFRCAPAGNACNRKVKGPADRTSDVTRGNALFCDCLQHSACRCLVDDQLDAITIEQRRLRRRQRGEHAFTDQPSLAVGGVLAMICQASEPLCNRASDLPRAQDHLCLPVDSVARTKVESTRCPTAFMDVWRLRDGTRLVLRQVLPQDASMLGKMVMQLIDFMT